MDFWHELKQTIEGFRSKGVRNNRIITECLRGIEILETFGGQEAAFVELVQRQPQLEDGYAAVNRWLVELSRKIDSALSGGRVLVLKTMHLTHGLREFFPFDDTTTLEHVEEHLRKCYRDSIHEYITKSTADLLPDGPIRLQFYAGSPRDGVEARPLDPETRVATIPGVDTDGVYWWPQSKQPIHELISRGALLSTGSLLASRYDSSDLVFPSIFGGHNISLPRQSSRIMSYGFVNFESGFVHLESFLREKSGDEKRSLSEAIERAFKAVITSVTQRSIGERTLRVDELLQKIVFQIIGSIPNQKLVIRCGEEVATVALPSRLAFYETGLMDAAQAEISNMTEKGGRETVGFGGHDSYKGKRSSRQGWRNYPRRTR